MAAGKPNTLLPVRVMERDEPGQPWRSLASTVVYRLGSGADEVANPPTTLNGASARWLRIESTSGVELGAEQLQAHAQFDPMQLASVASGDGPFELALGRPTTPPAAMSLGALTTALGQRKPQDLPQAAIGAARRRDPPRASVFRWIAPGQPAVLWTVLIAGVLILAAVAWTLLRRLKLDAPKA